MRTLGKRLPLHPRPPICFLRFARVPRIARPFLWLLLCTLPAAGAPYWKSLDLPGIHLLYQPGQENAARRSAAAAETAGTRVAGELGLLAKRPFTLVLHPTHREFAQATGIERRQLVVGIAASEGGTAHVDTSAGLSDLSTVVAHEVAHLLLAQAAPRKLIPLWFHEGYAEHASGRLGWSTREFLADRIATDGLFDFDLLQDTFPREGDAAAIAYAQSHALVVYILEHAPAAALPELTRRLRAGEPFPAALRQATGRDPAAWQQAWRNDFQQRFRWYPWLAIGAGASGLLMAALCVLAFRAIKRRKELLPDCDEE